MFELELIVTHSVRCRACGYHRYLSESEAANWKKGEYYSGSHRCPACGLGHQGSAAEYIGKPASPAKEAGGKTATEMAHERLRKALRELDNA